MRLVQKLNSKVDIKETTPDILFELAETAREADKVECYYQSGMKMLDGLDLSYSMSTLCKSGFYDGKLVMVWGITMVNLEEGIGQPWMIGTDEIENATLPFLRNCCYYLNEAKEGYNYLYNYVYGENDTAIRWLNWMNFKMDEAAPYGPFGAPFHRFHWRRG